MLLTNIFFVRTYYTENQTKSISELRRSSTTYGNYHNTFHNDIAPTPPNLILVSNVVRRRGQLMTRQTGLFGNHLTCVAATYYTQGRYGCICALRVVWVVHLKRSNESEVFSKLFVTNICNVFVLVIVNHFSRRFYWIWIFLFLKIILIIFSTFF